MTKRFAPITTAAILLGAGQAQALSDGQHGVYLAESDGARYHIADIDVKSGHYTVNLRSGRFADHFLSMRPFKCLEGPEKLWCHVPYPYEIKRDLTENLTDLEYDFLFLWKGAGEYGINMWNGVYYRLEEQPDGSLKGVLHEMDMDILSAPPEAGNLRPVREVDLEPGDPDSHWLPGLIVE